MLEDRRCLDDAAAVPREAVNRRVVGDQLAGLRIELPQL
jgi:hypothetical protein